MGKQDDLSLKGDSSLIPENQKKAGKSWAEEHGGLIFLVIVVSAISLVIVYDSCM